MVQLQPGWEAEFLRAEAETGRGAGLLTAPLMQRMTEKLRLTAGGLTPDGQPALVDPDRLMQLVLNLLRNAAEALDRVMRIEYRSGVLEIDFVKKSFRNTTGFPLDANFGENPQAKDSLSANVNAFLASVLDGAPVAVPAEAGLAALQVARDIDRLAVA